VHHISDWAVHSDVDFASDHFPITWRLSPSEAVHVDHARTVRFNFEDAADVWAEEFENLMTPASSMPDVPPFDEWVATTERLHPPMILASELAAQRKKPHPSPFPFVKEVKFALRDYRAKPSERPG